VREARVAVIGATGLVGRELVALLAQRRFPLRDLWLFATEGSEGNEIEFGDDALRVRALPHEPPGVDIAFLCTPADVSRRLSRGLAAAGALVVDLSSAAREDPGIPLVTAGPRVEGIAARAEGGVVLGLADPLTASMAAVLGPIAEIAELRRVVATALLSASTFGTRSVEGLARASAALLNAESPEDEDQERWAFSNVPTPGWAGLSSESVTRDLRRLVSLPVPIEVTLVRTPTFHGLAAIVGLETAVALDRDALRGQLRQAPWVLLEEGETPSVSTRDVLGSDAIHVVLLGADPADLHWTNVWIASDNVRQGAALNAVSVAEIWLRVRSSRA
jgi:aspartate-semialdehyde dehydrogenase